MPDDRHLDALAQMAGDDLDWEVLFLRCEEGCPVTPGQRLPDEYIPGDPLGPSESVKQSLTRLLPDIDWKYPDRGYLTRGQLQFDFNVHLDPVPLDVMLHVRGTGDPLPLICQVCSGLAWVAVDLVTWSVLDPHRPSAEGWSRVKGAIERSKILRFPRQEG